MTHKLTIGGQEIEIGWTQEAARRFAFRASKHKIKLDGEAFTDPSRAASAYVECLWLLLPAGEFGKHATPEDLAVAIDHDTESESVVAAVLACVGDMVADAEKKTSLTSGHLQESN